MLLETTEVLGFVSLSMPESSLCAWLLLTLAEVQVSTSCKVLCAVTLVFVLEMLFVLGTCGTRWNLRGEEMCVAVSCC